MTKIKSIFGLVLLLALMSYAQGAWAQATISGKVYVSSTKGIANVPVTDGFTTVLTDANGKYSFVSNKKSGIVYISIPSGYQMYENYQTTAAEKVFSPYWHAFTYSSPTKAETHNFRLKEVNNTNHKIVFMADPQICGRKQNGKTDIDKQHYQSMIIPRVKQEVDDAGLTPVYTITLGDNVFDEYWYSYSFTPASFVSMNASYGYPTKIFPSMGNHDNNGATMWSDSIDYEAARTYRMAMGPEYYSVNLGDIHYVFLDDIVYINTPNGKTGATEIVGERNYSTYVVEQQMKWLKEDLSRVDKKTPVVLSLHAPLWGVNSSYQTYSRINEPYGGAYAVCNLLRDFEKVEIFAGHRHQYFFSSPASFPNIHEHTVGNVMGNLSWATAYSGYPNCSDGVPGGYVLFNVNGKEYDWIYRDCLPNEEGAQFRVIDVNTWRDFYNTDSLYALLPKLSTSSGGTATHSYNDPNKILPANTVLLNVFNHDPSWKVQVFENGKALTVRQCCVQDVYHILACDRLRAKASNFCTDEMACWATHHMFYAVASSATSTVDIKVTDGFGNEFTRTVTLPLECSLKGLLPKNDVKLATGITEEIRKALTATIYVNNAGINIDAEKEGIATITSIDGKVSVKKIQAGHNEFGGLERGIYIVKTDNSVKKLFVK